MFVSRVFSRNRRNGFNQFRLSVSSSPSGIHRLSNISNQACGAQFLSASILNMKEFRAFGCFRYLQSKEIFQRFGISSSSAPQPNEKEIKHSTDEQGGVAENDASPQDFSQEMQQIESVKQNDIKNDLSFNDLVKLVAEKEELLKAKCNEVEKMQDKVLHSYAEMENIIDRTKRESENSKKFAIQNFTKSLLDVADNLGRASSVVKDSFEKIDQSKDSIGAVSLVKTLLEGVEMTEKQLAESGYMLCDRVIRPAEVGVSQSCDEDDQGSGA